MQGLPTSKRLLGTTEITCLAPLKDGFVDALDTRSYASRARVVLRTLHALRVASREARLARVIPDVVDAIRAIHTFRFAIVDNRRLLLAVTFDRPWEPYMRLVWRDLGPVLDLVLCNCDGYAGRSSDTAFERFASWVREQQIDCEFFYAASGLSVDDGDLLRALDERQRQGPPESFDREAAARIAADPVETTLARARDQRAETIEQARAALGVLFSLREWYPTEPAVLARATVSLLGRTFTQLALEPAERPLFGPALPWLDSIMPAAAPGGPASRRCPPAGAVQGDILEPYLKVTHGCLVLASITDAAEARRWLGTWLPAITKYKEDPDADGICTNIGFTYAGLRRIGVPDADAVRLPQEFREGMEARAGLLGDIRWNHPDRWSRPAANWPPGQTAPPVRLSTVDLVILLRKIGDWQNPHIEVESGHPLYERVQALAHGTGACLRVLSVQPMYRLTDASKQTRDHFDLADGISDPVMRADGGAGRPAGWDNTVETGELLVGYQNGRGDPPFPPAGAPGGAGWTQGSLVDNGSFLVVRKLRQHMDRLQKFLAEQVPKITPKITPEDLLARMVGRTVDGSPLVPTASVATSQSRAGKPPNDFDYAGDPHGDACPFHAHIRRANPRRAPSAQGEGPRIARRGLAYGPRVDGTPPEEGDRGLVFMAYNGSIAEQYEVIQRWMNGGSATGAFGAPHDPLVGVHESGDAQVFRFPRSGGVTRVPLPDTPFVTLEWGLYLFMPSTAALSQLAAGLPAPSPGAAGTLQITVAAQVEELQRQWDAISRNPGDPHAAMLRGRWEALIEEASAQHRGITEAVCAYIREAHGGVLHTPYGLLVASHALVREVLHDDATYSVAEYRRRMLGSVGDIYLGLDDGPLYRSLSAIPNALIQAITRQQAFEGARMATAGVLGAIAPPRQPSPVPLDRVVDAVLALLSRLWFDVPDGVIVREGGVPEFGASSVHCPFHFFAPSRYIFSSPHPRPFVERLGQAHGQAALQAVTALVAANRATFTAPISSALSAQIPGDDDLAQALVGLLLGLVPTVYGNFLKAMYHWVETEELWRRQQDLLYGSAVRPVPFADAEARLGVALRRTIQRRPVPDLIHRTATRDAALGAETVRPGDRVVLSLASAAQELRAAGVDDVSPAFGGDRGQPGHPTHACPGYEAGIGVLLGVTTALLEAGTLAPTGAHLVLRLTRP